MRSEDEVCHEHGIRDCAEHHPMAPDPVAALAERLHTVVCPSGCLWESCPLRSSHLLVADEALAFVRAQLPTREEIAITIFGASYDGTRWIGWRDADQAMYRRMADAILRDLTARLGD